MTILNAIKYAASTASKASYSGRVVIAKDESGNISIAEYTDNLSCSPTSTEVFSFPTSPYEHESAASLVRWAREELHV